MQQETNGVSAGQIRAARALLDWSQDDLALQAHLSVATIRKLELGHISPRHSTTHVIRQTIENAGLEFLNANGVRQRHEDITVYDGVGAAAAFFDDMHQTIGKTGGEVTAIIADTISMKSDEKSDGRSQLEKIISVHNNVHVKCLLSGHTTVSLAGSRMELRSLSKHYVDPTPFYVYADRYALVTPGTKCISKIVVIRSAMAAQASRRHFLSMWDKATPLQSNSST